MLNIIDYNKLIRNFVSKKFVILTENKIKIMLKA